MTGLSISNPNVFEIANFDGQFLEVGVLEFNFQAVEELVCSRGLRGMEIVGDLKFQNSEFSILPSVHKFRTLLLAFFCAQAACGRFF